MSNASVEQAQKSPVVVFEKQLNGYEKAITDLIQSKGLDPKEFMVTTINVVKRNPELLNCERATLLGAILQSAELGLVPNTPFGLSYIIPYNRSYKDDQGKWQKSKDAQFQIGYQGWLEIMYRNPRISNIQTHLIYNNEEFEEISGSKPDYIHKKKKPNERGEPAGVYAVAFLKDSDNPIIKVLWKEELEDFKKISQGAYKAVYKDGKPTGEKEENENSPWNSTDKDPQRWMWRKTVIKQLSKMLPKTTEIEKAYHVDNAVETGGRVVIAQDTVDAKAEVVEDDYMKNQNNVQRQEEKSQSAQEGTSSLFDQK